MSYSISLSDKATKQLKKLNKAVVRRIIDKLKTLSSEPYSKTLPLQDSEFRRLRIGDWRIILDIADDLKEVFVVLVGKRENIYEELEQSGG
ncbi:MAG: type II toxin-antitoxin system RelE/ParE family toxin [archaeon]